MYCKMTKNFIDMIVGKFSVTNEWITPVCIACNLAALLPAETGKVISSLQRILPPKVSFFVCQKVQIPSIILPEIQNFAFFAIGK